MDESIDSNSNSSPPISRRKNIIPGVDDAHLALGGVGVTLLALGVVSWPTIQDWFSKTFKMPPPTPNGAPPANGNAPPQQPVVVPPPPAVAAPAQVQQEAPSPYPYLRRNNIAPVGQAVSVSAMETVPDELPAPASAPQQRRNQGFDSPFGASISGEVG